MSQTPGRSVQSHLITSVGIANLVFGGLFVAFGAYCLLAGGDAVATLFQAKDEAAKAGAQAGIAVPAGQAQQIGDLADLGAKGLSGVILAMVGVVAGCSMLQGAPLLLVGAGVLGRRQWARVLALVFAVLAGIEGLACLSSVSQSRAFLVSAIVLPAYAVLSFVGLLGRRASAEFSGRADPCGEPVAAGGPPPIPPAERRSPAVPILSGLLGAAAVAAAFLAYPHFMPPAPHPDQPPPGKPAPDAAPNKTLIDAFTGKLPVDPSSGKPAPDAAPNKTLVDAFTGKLPVDPSSGKPPPDAPRVDAPRPKAAEWLPDLMAAAEGGQLSRILEVVARGALVDEKNEQGETALMRAAVKGHLQASALLLMLGAQINEKDAKGQTPLMLAAANGHDTLVELFVNDPNHADANDEVYEGLRKQVLSAAPVDPDRAIKDPLHAFYLKLLTPEDFKPPHAVVDARDAEGQTAFRKAVLSGHHDAAQMLLAHARGSATDNEGNTIRHLAARKGNMEILKQFTDFRSGDKTYRHAQYGYPHSAVFLDDADNNQGMSAWMIAAAEGHLEAMQWLLPMDPSKELINRKKRDGKTALELAAAQGHQDVVDYLKPLAGVDAVPMPAPTKKEPSALMKAVDAGDLEAVQSLLKANGLSADDCDEEDKTVLMHAAAKEDARIVLLLCAYLDAKPLPGYLDRVDKEGRTPLIQAAAGGRAAVVEALLFAVTAHWDKHELNWFATLNHKDKSGKTALEQAEAQGDKATGDLLRAYVKDKLNVRNESQETALEDASERGDLPSVEGLLKLGASKDRYSESISRSALMLAVEGGHILVVQAILDSFGDDQNARDAYMGLVWKGGNTAETLADSHGHKQITAMLQKYKRSK